MVQSPKAARKLMDELALKWGARSRRKLIMLVSEGSGVIVTLQSSAGTEEFFNVRDLLNQVEREKQLLVNALAEMNNPVSMVVARVRQQTREDIENAEGESYMLGKILQLSTAGMLPDYWESGEHLGVPGKGESLIGENERAEVAKEKAIASVYKIAKEAQLQGGKKSNNVSRTLVVNAVAQFIPELKGNDRKKMIDNIRNTVKHKLPTGKKARK